MAGFGGPPRRRWATRFASVKRRLPGIEVEVSSDCVDGQKHRVISCTIKRPAPAQVPSLQRRYGHLSLVPPLG
jgi:hypothetical protein